MELPEAFLSRMRAEPNFDYEAFIAQYERPSVRGLRVNTLKISKEEFLRLSPWRLEQTDMLDEGFIINDEINHIGSDPYHFAGLFYMQEPSAMSVIEHSDIYPGMKVLDLCAAPGGKSGGIASRLAGSGLLVSNEPVLSRARLLLQNLERLGVMNSVVVNAYPNSIAEALPRYFDRVIVDAPCSGEGMFRKDARAIAEWSPEHVLSCAARQKAILNSAAECVAPGAKLIYSTCTFSHEENEAVIESFLLAYPDFKLEFMQRYYPHTCHGEGHFVARLRSVSETTDKTIHPFKLKIDKKAFNIVSAFLDDTFIALPYSNHLHLDEHSGRVFYVQPELPETIAKLNVLNLGVEVGSPVKGRLKPSHAIFMAESSKGSCCFTAKNRIILDYHSPQIKQFLSGNTLSIESTLSGFMPVTVDGFPVGFGKAVDGTLKNHLPKGLAVAYYR